MSAPDLSAKQLREAYQKGTLRQRYGIACSRIDNPELGHSVLINAYAALEGYARAVAVRLLVNAGVSLKDAYSFHRQSSMADMIEKHICPAYKVTPSRLFGSAWLKIPEAVEFRNILVHDATSLNGGTCKTLIGVLRHCLYRLAEISMPDRPEIGGRRQER